jgi:hypothetical protein
MSGLLVILLFTLSFSGRIIRFIQRRWKKANEEGNLCVAEVESARVQKVPPQKGREPGLSSEQTGRTRLEPAMPSRG